MEKLRISTGDIVEISQLNQKEKTQPYISVVENYDGLHTVLVNSPISQSQYIRLPLNKQYLVRFISKKGVYRIIAKVTQYTSEGDIQFTELKLLGNGRRIQQRNFYRLPYTNVVNFQIKTEDEAGVHFTDETYNGIIRDLSGGGIKMVSKTNIEIHGIIKFNLQLDDKTYELFGKIMVKKHEQHALQPYSYGVMFLGISEDDREKLLLFLHYQQLKQLQ